MAPGHDARRARHAHHRAQPRSEVGRCQGGGGGGLDLRAGLAADLRGLRRWRELRNRAHERGILEPAHARAGAGPGGRPVPGSLRVVAPGRGAAARGAEERRGWRRSEAGAPLVPGVAGGPAADHGRCRSVVHRGLPPGPPGLGGRPAGGAAIHLPETPDRLEVVPGQHRRPMGAPPRAGGQESDLGQRGVRLQAALRAPVFRRVGIAPPVPPGRGRIRRHAAGRGGVLPRQHQDGGIPVADRAGSGGRGALACAGDAGRGARRRRRSARCRPSTMPCGMRLP